MATFETLLGSQRIVPVVTVDEADTACRIAEALLAGGISIIEITLRRPGALAAIAAVRSALPEMVVGCGTLRAPADVTRAVEAGSQFLVSPGTTPALLDAYDRAPVPVLPGASSISEMMLLAERGFPVLKLFPAQAIGGLPLIRAAHSVLPELQFCPTGGIGADEVRAYLACGGVACVGGSWLTPDAAVAAQDWARITDLARTARGLGRD